MKTEMKCNGSCCERFFLPAKMNEIWKHYEDFILTGVMKWEDLDKIAPMVIPLDDEGLEGESEKGYWYTCKHWDQETRLCKIYEQRPQMCRNYPYSSPCTHCGWENEEFLEEQKNKLRKPGGININ